jgi:hypothetical protein
VRIAALRSEPMLITPIKKRRINKIKPVPTVDPAPPRVNMARLRREQKGRIDIYV